MTNERAIIEFLITLQAEHLALLRMARNWSLKEYEHLVQEDLTRLRQLPEVREFLEHGEGGNVQSLLSSLATSHPYPDGDPLN
jgi:hypothetical protein